MSFLGSQAIKCNFGEALYSRISHGTLRSADSISEAQSLSQGFVTLQGFGPSRALRIMLHHAGASAVQVGFAAEVRTHSGYLLPLTARLVSLTRTASMYSHGKSTHASHPRSA